MQILAKTLKMTLISQIIINGIREFKLKQMGSWFSLNTKYMTQIMGVPQVLQPLHFFIRNLFLSLRPQICKEFFAKILKF